MLFNSFEFAVFFPIVTAAYFVTPSRARWATLLAASALFYAALIPVYLLVLAGMIVIDYAAGVLIERSHGTVQRWMLGVSLASNLGILGVFKYYDFFVTTASSS